MPPISKDDGYSMRLILSAFTAVLAGCLPGLAPARADHAPALVVPGRPDVPVIVDGRDVSWSVIEGDWGLYRPGAVTPTVTYPYVVADPYWRRRAYFPATGHLPRYGRREIIPSANRHLPEPAESFHRYWSTQPDSIGVDYPPLYPPPVISAPRPAVKSLD
jgi:hypothetical protein